MSKNELVQMFYKLDKGKYKLLQKGVSFQLTIEEDGKFLQTGIGTGLTMSVLNLYGIVALYKSSAKGVTIEEFAESVKQGVISAYNENAFEMGEIE